MSISNLFDENGYNLFCNTLTCNQIINKNRSPDVEVRSLCLSTTLAGAQNPNGTAAHTVVSIGTTLYFNNNNGICHIWKEGSSPGFPLNTDNATLKTNLSNADRLYILARSSTPTADDGGAVFIPAGTFPLCSSTLPEKVYYSQINMKFPLKQNTVTPVDSISVPVSIEFHSLDANGQYFEIIIPRGYDYIVDGDNGITATVNTQSPQQFMPLNTNSQQVRYTQQLFSGGDTAALQNSLPPFYLEYPVQSN